MGTGGQSQDGKIQAVLTCQGDIEDPEFPERCQKMFDKLSQVLQNDELDVTKCEPWNSVKVTFNIPKDAAEKLSKLAEAGDEVLRELGILSLQMEGGQVISMTMVEESDSEDERVNPSVDAKPSTSRPQASKPKPKEEKPLIKQEIDSTPQPGKNADPAYPGRPPGTPSSGGTSSFGLPFPSLVQAAQQQAIATGGSRDTLSAVQSLQGLSPSAAAMLLKNHSSSAASLLSPAEQSVLQSYSCGVASLMSSRGLSSDKSSGVSPLLGHLLKDNNDEPLSKKPRKTESASSINLTSQKSKLDTTSGANNSIYPFNKVVPGAGFSLLPVSSAAAATSLRSITGSQSNSLNPESQRTSPVGSALRLASLPGVSLTAVNSRNTQPPVSSHSQKLSRASLMPPPNSAVTLSPVPRTTQASVSSAQSVVSTNPAELRCIETGDISPKPLIVRNSVDISPPPSIKQSLNSDNRPLLINPVTGQFEAGSTENALESENDNSKKGPLAVNDLEENSEERLRHTKHKSGSQSPGNSTSEPSLKFKLKVSSIQNNSSKNVVTQKNDVLKNNVSNKLLDEPKVPKIKIRLGKDKNAVKLDNDMSENHESNDLDDSLSPEKSLSPIQNDLKTKIKIKPLGSKSPHEDAKEPPLNNISPYFPNLTNNIANHTSVDDRKNTKKVIKKEKVKDRLTIWTESLAKHGQREEGKEKEDKVKETKTWPEVLESRLFGSSSLTNSNSIPTNSSSSVLSFNKSEPVLENQTDKGGESDKSNSGSIDSESPHLNWAGPGREPPEPGPGHALQPLPGNQQPDQKPELEPEPHPKSKQENSLSVLDILEGRPPLGEPPSPGCPLGSQNGSQDQGGQQGEDSGIESMDSRSEKSPNQGESPFHAASESGVDMGHTPTYSSSMGSASGKMSPPVSDSGSTDSAVTTTPPDKSPSATASNPVQNSSVSVELSTTLPTTDNKFLSDPVEAKEHQDSLEEGHNTEVTNPSIEESHNPTANSTSADFESENTNSCGEHKEHSPDPKNSLEGQVMESPDPEKSKLMRCDSITSKNEASNDISCIPNTEDNIESSETLDDSKCDALKSIPTSLLKPSIQAEAQPSLHRPATNDEPKTDNLETFENHKNDLEAKSEEVLLRSCDGADDPKISPPKDSINAEPIEITNCMHDYTYKDSNTVSNKNDNINDTMPSASVKSTLLTKRLIDDSVKVESLQSLPSTAKVSENSTMQAPVTTVNFGGLGPGIQVRPALHVPPGARMVPVKLVTVPGAGNMRMLRVSPVKSGVFSDGKVTSIGPSGLPPRTVVIKSSILKAVSTQDFLETAASLGTASVVRYPMPGMTTTAPSTSPVNCDKPASSSQEDPSQTSVSLPSILTPNQGISLLKKSHVNLTPVENNLPPSHSLDPSCQTKAAPVTFEKRTSVDESKSISNTEVSQASPLSVDVSNRLTDSEQMPSPAQKAAQKSTQKVNGEDAMETVQPSSPKPERKGKKSSGDSIQSESSDGDSLLRPLLAKEDLDQCVVNPPSPLPNLDSPSTLTLPLINPRKRSRRDTGSSATSDRSDLSVLSEPAFKKNKDDSQGKKASSPVRRKSQSADKNNRPEKDEDSDVEDRPDLPEDEVAISDENTVDERIEDANVLSDTEVEETADNEKVSEKLEHDNGIADEAGTSKKPIKPGERPKGRPPNALKNTKLAAKKPSPKKSGVKKVGRPKNEENEKGSPTGAPGKTDTARRVSTRSKKPDEQASGSKRR